MASNPSSSRSTVVVWGVAIALIALALIAVRSFTRERVPIRTAAASYQDLQITTSTNGKIEPVEDFQAHAPLAGEVKDVYVHLGEKVKKGQLLLRMDDASALANLAHAQSSLSATQLSAKNIDQNGSQDERNTYASNLVRAQAQVQADQASIASLEKLQQQGAASAAELTGARHRLSLDEEVLKSAQQHGSQRYSEADRANALSQVADARAAVAAAQSAYDNVNIRSQIDGTVYYLPVAQYDYVDPSNNGDLVYVADLSHLRVTAYFDEPDIGRLRIGQPVSIKWEARRDKTWHGHVSQVPTTIISYGTRNVGECFITVDDADGILQPNANVTVTVTIANRHHVLVVPHESVHFDGPNAYVFRVINGKLVRTPVNIGLINDNWVEILSGLREGDVVARNPLINRELTDGLEVKAVE